MEQLDEKRQQLDNFFKQQQNRSYNMAYVLTQNKEDALELVQDSMLRLVQSYAARPAEQWPLLYYRILQNCIRDFRRRQALKKLFHLYSPAAQDPQQPVIDQLSDPRQINPQQNLEQSGQIQRILRALKNLPLRQQQTFLLRAWQEFSVSETASILSISEGSVKTHYSRALTSLRQHLGDIDA